MITVLEKALQQAPVQKTPVHTKVIQSGRMVEVWEYQFPTIGKTKSTRTGESNATEEEREEWRKNNKRQAFHNLIRLGTANFSCEVKSRFITLTFEENIKDVEKANYEFKKFIQRLRYKYGNNFKYIAAIEFQDKYERGAVHYHMLSDISYIKWQDLKAIWGNGGIDIKLVYTAKHAAVYIGKYMAKGFYDKRLAGVKNYFTSRNLIRPDIYKNETGQEVVESIRPITKEKNFEGTYLSKWNGKVRYRKYFIDKNAEMPKSEPKFSIQVKLENLLENIPDITRTNRPSVVQTEVVCHEPPRHAFVPELPEQIPLFDEEVPVGTSRVASF